jgi:hypothetical protein
VSDVGERIDFAHEKVVFWGIDGRVALHRDD